MNLAVGICSLNRPHSLNRLCLGLLPHAPILVSDDGSREDIARAVPWPVELLKRTQHGLASNRNWILFNLFNRPQTDAVLILDDDMEALDGWREAWTTAIAEHGLVAFDWGGGTSACAVGISRDAFNVLGFFDLAYDMGWGYEDAEYFRRWERLTGKRPGSLATGFVHHGGKGENCSPERLERNAELFNRT